MNTYDSASAYRQSMGFAASAVGQVIALYDTILRDLRNALAAVEAGQIEARVNATNHAMVIMGELQGVLDFGNGGEPARNLNNFYNVMRRMTTHASMTDSREEFLELISHFARIRAAWSQVERNVAPSAPANRLRISSTVQTAFSQNAPLPSEGSDTSANGRWKA